MRAFVATARYTYVSHLRWLPPVAFLAQKVLVPLGSVTFFSQVGVYGGSQSPEFYFLGNAMTVAIAGGFFVGLTLTQEREQGTLIYLVASPASRLEVFFGRAVFPLIEGFLFVLLAFAWTKMLFDFHLHAGSNWVVLLVPIMSATVAAAGLGLLLGTFVLLGLDWRVVGSITGFAIFLLSGANVPLEELPQAAYVLSKLFPVTRSILAVRSLAAGDELAASVPLILTDVGIGVAYGVLAVLLFAWVVRRGRRHGTLERI